MNVYKVIFAKEYDEDRTFVTAEDFSAAWVALIHQEGYEESSIESLINMGRCWIGSTAD